VTFRVFSCRASDVTVDPTHRGAVRPNEAESPAQACVLPQADGTTTPPINAGRRSKRDAGIEPAAA
jgi:hypothetical protein